MDATAQELFDLIDAAYNEDLTKQPAAYRQCLLKLAGELTDGTDSQIVCLKLFKVYHTNYIVPMTLPVKNRALYAYVKNRLQKLNRKQLRDANIGYGLIASSYTFGSLN